MSRFCEECGTPLEPNENFCSNCGAKVIRDEPPQPPPVKSTPQPTYTPPVNQPSTQPTYTPPKSTPAESTSPSAKNHMGKFLALIGILVLIGVVTYFAINRQSDGEALNELYIGMSKDEADRKFGAGNFVMTPESKGYRYADGKIYVNFDSNNKAELISCSNETVNTKKGIHVGSTFDEVKRAYGNNYQFVNGVRYLYTLGDSLLVFFVSKETNRVNSITLETSEETSLGNFYLGMSKDEADDRYGAGTPDGSGYYYENGNYWVKFDSDNKANMIACWDERVYTKRGIRVGSTLDEVKRAYGNDYQFNDTTFKENPAYIYTLGNSKLFFFMDKDTNCVFGIRLDTLRR